ncbi:MAG: type II toxin-antitoxin system HicB family antitoxin [Dehalococcoidia bacterium]
MTTATIHRYVVVLKPATDDGEVGYTVNVPALPGCITEGDTVDEALVNAREAIEAYLLSLKDRNLPAPPSDEVVTSLEVELPS